jgi:hypothetical protein
MVYCSKESASDQDIWSAHHIDRITRSSIVVNAVEKDNLVRCRVPHHAVTVWRPLADSTTKSLSVSH